jgi:nucleoside-diphosphate-sugar epimerase
MVIGSGIVAKSFELYNESEDVIIFASGVSNSKLAVRSEFEREQNLLIKTLEKHEGVPVVYFSTFNLYDPEENNSPYCLHKLNMEELIAANSIDYKIFRLGHVASYSAKQYTILSFLYNAIKDGGYFELWKYASRNIIDIEDVSKICSFIIDNNLYSNQITNICNSKNSTILEIVSILERILHKKANYSLVDKGGCPVVDNSKIKTIAKDLCLNFDDFYVDKVIYKYYANSLIE